MNWTHGGEIFWSKTAETLDDQVPILTTMLELAYRLFAARVRTAVHATKI